MPKSSRVPLEQIPRSFRSSLCANSSCLGLLQDFCPLLSVLPGWISLLRILEKESQIISELKSPSQTWEIPVDGTVPVFSAPVLKPGFSILLCLHAAFLFQDFINTAKLILITVIIQLY